MSHTINKHVRTNKKSINKAIHVPIITCVAAFNIQDLVQYAINTDASGKVAIAGIDNGLVYKSYTETYIVKTEEQAKLSKNFSKKK